MNKIHFVGRAGTAFENTTPCGLDASGKVAGGAKDESHNLSNVTCKKCLKFTKSEGKVKMRDRGKAKMREIKHGGVINQRNPGDVFLEAFGIEKVTNFEIARALEDCPKDILEELAVLIIRFRADE